MPHRATVPATAARPFLGTGLIGLHRAIVSLPDALTDREQPLHERIVFFEAPADAHPSSHLEALLALAWNVDTTGWAERGFIYNCDSAFGMLWDANAAGDDTSDLSLFETGAGGPDGIGPQHIHYARAARVDFFVTPLLAQRLTSALDSIERLYATSQAAAAGCSPEPLKALAKRVANLNSNHVGIGAGMLASLVDDANRALGCAA